MANELLGLKGRLVQVRYYTANISYEECIGLIKGNKTNFGEEVIGSTKDSITIGWAYHILGMVRDAKQNLLVIDTIIKYMPFVNVVQNEEGVVLPQLSYHLTFSDCYNRTASTYGEEVSPSKVIINHYANTDKQKSIEDLFKNFDDTQKRVLEEDNNLMRERKEMLPLEIDKICRKFGISSVYKKEAADALEKMLLGEINPTNMNGLLDFVIRHKTRDLC